MENQEDINRSNKKRQSPENRAIKKKRTISCLNEACTTIKTSKEKCNKQLPVQREKNQKLNGNLKTESNTNAKESHYRKNNSPHTTNTTSSTSRQPKGKNKYHSVMASSLSHSPYHSTSLKLPPPLTT